MRRVFVYSIATLLLLVPTLVLAADPIFEQAIVPECVGMCQVCDLVKLANNILQFMVAASVLIATLMFAYAGFLYITATSSPKNIGTAKSIFTNVFTGLVLILTAWLIVDLILSVFTGKNIGFYSEIQCVEYVPSKDGWTVSDAPPANVNGSVSGGGNSTAGTCVNCVPITALKCKKAESCAVPNNVNLKLIQLASDLEANNKNPDDYVVTETGINQTVQHASGASNLDIGCPNKVGGACSVQWVKDLNNSWSGKMIYETNTQSDFNEKLNAGIPRSNLLLIPGKFNSDGSCPVGVGGCITAPHASLK